MFSTSLASRATFTPRSPLISGSKLDGALTTTMVSCVLRLSLSKVDGMALSRAWWLVGCALPFREGAVEITGGSTVGERGKRTLSSDFSRGREEAGPRGAGQGTAHA